MISTAARAIASVSPGIFGGDWVRASFALPIPPC
jgi:hypothetical protein